MAETTMSKQSARESRPPISAYIRTLNEERLIERVVRAALEAAREVIVVDSGSTDKTCAIAEAAGARVIGQPWLGFGAQKRVGEDAAENPWMLDIDGDEVISPELAEELRALFREGETDADGWGAPPLSVYTLLQVTAPPLGEPWPFAADARAKLYDRRRHRIPDDRAWDQLQLNSSVKIGALRGALMHHSFRDYDHFVAKWNMATTMFARELKPRRMWVLVMRILFARPFYFWRHYLIRGFWRGGLYGFIVSRGAGFGRWMRDVKMYERRRGLK